MSSWLNFNESLNNIKGQISTFANNVLTDEGEDNSTTEVEELRKLCSKQELEIRRLTEINQELKAPLNDDGNGTWNWNIPKPTETTNSAEISTLKQRIKELEDEKNEVFAQLEQLDLENQQNLQQINDAREKLREENEELKEKLCILKKQAEKAATSQEKQLVEIEKDRDKNEDSDSLHEKNQKLKAEVSELKKEIHTLTTSNIDLQETVKNIQLSTEKEISSLKEDISKKDAETKIIYSELQKSKKIIKDFEDKCAEDAETSQKLAFILENYEKQVRDLKNELETLKDLECVNEQNKQLREDKEQLAARIKELCWENDILNRQSVELDSLGRQDDLIDSLNENIEELSKQITENEDVQDFIVAMKNEILDLDINHDERYELLTPKDVLTKVRDGYKSLKEKSEKLLAENENIHKIYVNILTNKVRQYYEGVECSDSSENPQILEFSKHVEHILKIMLDLKTKSELLEKETYELSEEKTRILNEKNYEIEKLIQNSEILSQEVISKTETIKDYERECNDLLKNNQILLNELQEYKNNSSLQTISESNEDNVVLLESQLEKANGKIQKLEEIIAQYKNLKEEIQPKQELPKAEEPEKDTERLEEENLDLKNALEKSRLDYENVEYQLTEVTVQLEALKEELETSQQKITELLEDNKQSQKIAKHTEDLRSELNHFKEMLLLEEDSKHKLQMEVRNITEKLKNAKMNETTLKVQHDSLCKEFGALNDKINSLETVLGQEREDKKELENKLLQMEMKEKKLNEELCDIRQELQTKNESTTTVENDSVKETIDNIQDKDSPNGDPTEKQESNEHVEKIKILEQQVAELVNSKNELINMVTTKHHESVTYHNEIQRLSQILQTELAKFSELEERFRLCNEELSKKNEEIDKLSDQNAFLKEKCEVLTKNLLEEQSKAQQNSGPSEKEQALAKKLERLQAHLIEQEEHYTRELVQAEQKNQELLAKVTEIEQREKNCSTMYTSVSIRANQQVESLQSQLESITRDRDALRRKISDIEDSNSKQATALANLQFVLEQFQKDKEKDVRKETERIRRQIEAEQAVQEKLRKEIVALNSQLEESRQGLQAASRLSDQLENSKKQCSQLKEQVNQLLEKLSKNEEKLKETTSQTDGKVDKSLIKNLVVGYVASNPTSLNKDQQQILKIIATVLDFNQQDHEKVKLNQSQQKSWLSSILSPQDGSQGMSQESLSRAFIKFLENESKPREIPSLLSEEQSQVPSRKNTPPRQSPMVLSEIVLPTFADFGQTRNSSSILKDVLKDNS